MSWIGQLIIKAKKLAHERRGDPKMDVNALLGALCVPDNAQRRAAEGAYENAKKESPDQLAMSLIQATNAEALPPHLRSLAAVLLRRLVSGPQSEWEKIGSDTQGFIRTGLMERVVNEEDDNIRRFGALFSFVKKLPLTSEGWPCGCGPLTAF